LDLLVRQARRLKDEIAPNTLSPIARALVAARDEGFAATYRGPRLILALTDGDDNYSGHLSGRVRLRADDSNLAAYNRDVRDYLKEEFEKRRIAIHMVCFN